MTSCPCCANDERTRALSVAPMIEVTDRHYRMLVRTISPGPSPQLWSEMTWDNAMLYNTPSEPEYYTIGPERHRDIEEVYGFSPEERPLVLQLGGSDPDKLARSARLGEQAGYDEINLNCGCPAQTRGRSRNCFGARLMFDPQLVADCCAAMIEAVRIPVSVKIRLGVNEHDTYAELHKFVQLVSAVGVRHFVVHARKAILNLDTAKNRSVPPLRHEWVFALLEDFPHLKFYLNGGVTSLAQAAALIRAGVHGVMIGRRARAHPYMFALTRDALAYAYASSDDDASALSESQCLTCGSSPPRTRRQVLEAYAKYCSCAQQIAWTKARCEQVARSLLCPLTGLFYDTPAARMWKQMVSTLMHDFDRLRAEPVESIIQWCIQEVIAAPSPIGEAATQMLDTTPVFNAGLLPSGLMPPTRPCVVQPNERARGADERSSRKKRADLANENEASALGTATEECQTLMSEAATHVHSDASSQQCLGQSLRDRKAQENPQCKQTAWAWTFELSLRIPKPVVLPVIVAIGVATLVVVVTAAIPSRR